MRGVEMEEAGRRAGVGGHTGLVSLGLRGPACSPTHLLAHKKAGSHSQPMREVVYGIGQ